MSLTSSTRIRIYTRIASCLYLLLIAASLYLLFMSRSGEVYTVWQAIHPAFMPTLFVTTLLLLVTVFLPLKIEYKLLFIIIYSILIHSFFVIVFPAGDVSGHQITLGKTRLVFDNVIRNGWPPTPVENILTRIYYWFGANNFQISLSVIFARMFSIDVYWVHLMLIPVLWGTFVPVAVFMVTKTLGASGNISALSSLLISSFPLTVSWGAISVHFSLGVVFFSFSLYFILRYLSSKEAIISLLTVASCFISFLAHFLTGIMSFSLLLLATALKKYEDEKKKAPQSAKILLSVSFVLCTSLLPLALIYLKLFYPLPAYLSLDKLHGSSIAEIAWLFILGEYVNFEFFTAMIFVFGPIIGFAGMIYVLRATSKKRFYERHFTLFLFMVFLMLLIDYRILRLFMVGVPFRAERIWVFGNFVLAAYFAVAINGALSLFHKKSDTLRKPKIGVTLSALPPTWTSLRSVVSGILIIISLSGLVTASVYYGYPNFGPLQTTSYELEAAKYIDEATTGKYIVVCDQWMIYAGEMIVGVYNPHAFYFSSFDPKGVELFIEMKSNPSTDTMIEAMETNNSSIAYFIIEKPRLGTEEYNSIKFQAIQNGLKILALPKQVSHYQDEEKLCIFYYK